MKQLLGITPDPNGHKQFPLGIAHLFSQKKEVGFSERAGGIQGDTNRVDPL